MSSELSIPEPSSIALQRNLPDLQNQNTSADTAARSSAYLRGIGALIILNIAVPRMLYAPHTVPQILHS